MPYELDYLFPNFTNFPHVFLIYVKEIWQVAFQVSDGENSRRYPIPKEIPSLPVLCSPFILVLMEYLGICLHDGY